MTRWHYCLRSHRRRLPAQQVDQQGDRVEVRRLEASDALTPYLDWPGAAQVCWVERTTRQKGRVFRESRYAITSRRTEPDELLQRVRGHWAIENRLHWVRDVSLGEDACQVRSGSAPEVLAALRNVVIAALRHAGRNMGGGAEPQVPGGRVEPGTRVLPGHHRGAAVRGGVVDNHDFEPGSGRRGQRGQALAQPGTGVVADDQR